MKHARIGLIINANFFALGLPLLDEVQINWILLFTWFVHSASGCIRYQRQNDNLLNYDKWRCPSGSELSIHKACRRQRCGGQQWDTIITSLAMLRLSTLEKIGSVRSSIYIVHGEWSTVSCVPSGRHSIPIGCGLRTQHVWPGHVGRETSSRRLEVGATSAEVNHRP